MKKIKTVAVAITACLAVGALATSCMFLPDKDEKLDFKSLKLLQAFDFDDDSLDTDYWNEQVWNPGVVNNEVQSYVKGNAKIVDDDTATDGKILRLTATSTNGSTWKSSRIDTATKFNFNTGYIEARLRMPVAYDKNGDIVENKGVWPAFWMMPENLIDEDGKDTKGGVYGTWPRSGELDIMEYSPSTSGEKTYSTIHHALSKTDGTDQYSSLGSIVFDDPYDWHTYGLYWTSGTLEAFYDGVSLGTVYANPGNENWAKWPYDQDFYIILNLAMGGNLGGAINKEMRKVEYDVDYIHVYKTK